MGIGGKIAAHARTLHATYQSDNHCLFLYFYPMNGNTMNKANDRFGSYRKATRSGHYWPLKGCPVRFRSASSRSIIRCCPLGSAPTSPQTER